VELKDYYKILGVERMASEKEIERASRASTGRKSSGLYDAMSSTRQGPIRASTDHEYTLHLQEWLSREGLTYPALTAR